MAGPVRKLVEGGAIVAGRVLEGFLRRQMDAVGGRAIERTFALVVCDLCPGIKEDALAAVNCLECGTAFALERRDTVDLFGVEDRVHPVNEAALILFGGFVAPAPVRFTVLLFRLRLHLPEFDVRSL